MPTPTEILSDNDEGADHIEFILLDCYQKLYNIPSGTFDNSIVRENIQSLYAIVSNRCTHSESHRIASLYFIKKDMMFREYRLCHYCYNNAYTCLKELVEMDPFNAFVGFFASVGRVTGYYRFVLII